MRKFWNFDSFDEGESILSINGYIAEESWFSDDVTPKIFKSELDKVKGNLTVWVNSYGGEVWAASQIYTMLQEHKSKGRITVKIDGIAASAASVIAMSGDEILMSPTSCLMIHNPASFIYGEVKDLENGIELLTEVKESIINSYAMKTGLSRAKISHMMDDETWMSAQKAVDLGFADSMMYKNDDDVITDSYMWSNRSAVLATVNAMRQKLPQKNISPKTQIDSLDKRLSLLK